MKQLYFFTLTVFTCFINAQPPISYYDSAAGLENFALKTALKNIIDDNDDGNGQPFHDTTVTYSDLWTLYTTSDVRSDGKVWDMYSQCNFTFGTDQDTGTGGGSECDKYNREHTFPRSWFGNNSNLAIFSDAFHVVPSDKKVNAIRGNLAYGEVATPNYTSLNNSKRGTSSITGSLNDVFEPADEYKGDLARGIFYVVVRYEDLIASWENNDPNGNSVLDGSSDKVFEQWALDMLYNWHINDPVSQKEIDRNNAIFAHQDNRNPFIDNPQWVFNIWKTTLSNSENNFKHIKIFPNPATDIITIDLPNSTKTKVEIYDMLGKKVWQKQINQSTIINTKLFKSGIYLMKLKQGNNTSYEKLIVK